MTRRQLSLDDLRNARNVLVVESDSSPDGKKITGGDRPGVDPFVNQRLHLDHPEGHFSLTMVKMRAGLIR